MNFPGILAMLLQVEDTPANLVSDRIIGVIVAIMFLVGVVWMIKRIAGRKTVDWRMSVRSDDDSSETLPRSLPRLGTSARERLP
jgi:hypothetical protein